MRQLVFLRHGGRRLYILTLCHVRNKVPSKNQDQTPYDLWNGRKPSLSLSSHLGCLAKFNVPISKKCKLGSKIVDCVFLGYTQRSMAYRFSVVKSEISGVHVQTTMKFSDVTFF